MTGDYDWLTLDEDEEIRWEGEIARESLYGVYAVGGPLVLLFGLGLLLIVPAHLRRRHTDYVFTNKGVYKKTGILSRSVTEVEYDKVQNSAYSAGPIARYLGYGDVEISTAGGSSVEMRLRAVEDPQAVQKHLSRLVKRAQGAEGGDEEAEDPGAVLEDILGELRAIRTALDVERGQGRPDDESGQVRPSSGPAEQSDERAADDETS